MSELKIHLAIRIKRTAPNTFRGETVHPLCVSSRAMRMHTDRSKVTCNICNHFIKEFGDKYVIPRGNAPAATFSYAEELRRYRAAAWRQAFNL